MTTNQKHPNGGRLVGNLAANGTTLQVCDTRKLHGKPRRVLAMVFSIGADKWEVVKNPGENYTVVGQYAGCSPWAAYEQAVSSM